MRLWAAIKSVFIGKPRTERKVYRAKPKTYTEALRRAKEMGVEPMSDGTYPAAYLSGIFNVSEYAYMTPRQKAEAIAERRRHG